MLGCLENGAVMANRKKYETQVKPFIHQIKQLRRSGASIEQIAEELHISRSTFLAYRKEFEELREALADEQFNFDKALANVAEEGLMTNVKDRFITERTSEVFLDENDVRIKSHVVEKQKFIPANPTLVIFALKNKLPDKYNKLDAELTQARTEAVKQNMTSNQDAVDVGQEILNRLGNYQVKIDVSELDKLKNEND